MAYCIAFSIDGATDVTRRYVRSAARHGLSRTRAPEEVVLWVIHEIRRMRREKLPKDEVRRLMKEDEREERELRGYMIQSITAEINNLMPSRQPTSTPEEVKVPVTGPNGTVEWVDATPGQPNHNTPGDPR
jgi:peptide-N4-(N-acetyl-beta-glucosaminyl)asparagine amidase